MGAIFNSHRWCKIQHFLYLYFINSAIEAFPIKGKKHFSVCKSVLIIASVSCFDDLMCCAV